MVFVGAVWTRQIEKLEHISIFVWKLELLLDLKKYIFNNTVFQQVCIKLIKSDIKYIYKDLFFK